MDRLHDAGLEHVFGIPGDFCLGLLDDFIKKKDKIEYVGCSNELNAAYAADGYARIKGIGALVTTYAVGELSAINGVAGSWAECVPVINIVGCPARKHFSDRALLHHTLGDYMKPFSMFKHITAAQAMVMDPNTCASEIQHVLNVCLLSKRPVYIGIPSDMVKQEIRLESPIYSNPYVPPSPKQSDPEVLKEAVADVAGTIAKAKRPVFIPGVELIRRNLESTFAKLTEKTKIPYVTMLLSKGILSETHDNFIGLYSGARSRPEVAKIIEDSDCVIILGEKLTDFNTGGFSAPLVNCKRILIDYDHTQISYRTYSNVYVNDMLERLVEAIKPIEPYSFKKGRDACVHRRSSNFVPNEKAELTMSRLFARMGSYLPENCVVLAETGASLFSAAETMMPEGTVFIGQTFYGSIGYSVGATLGVCMAVKKQNRLVINFVGDGSFQLTCQAVSTMITYKVNPMIILINNDGYLIERVITDNIYNDIQMWKYARLPEIFGGKAGPVCITEGDFEKALKDKNDTYKNDVQLIEVKLGKWDCNQLLKDAGKAMAKVNGLVD